MQTAVKHRTFLRRWSVQVMTGPSVGLFRCDITFGVTQEEQNNPVNLKSVKLNPLFGQQQICQQGK